MTEKMAKICNILILTDPIMGYYEEHCILPIGHKRPHKDIQGDKYLLGSESKDIIEIVLLSTMMLFIIIIFILAKFSII